MNPGRGLAVWAIVLLTLNVCNAQATPARFSVAGSSGFSACPQFFADKKPPLVPAHLLARTKALCYDGFAILYSGTSKTPVFVAQRLSREGLLQARNEVRSGGFFQDARLPFADRATLEDYRGSGYDRGHMAPAGDMANATMMSQSFSLANIVPQAPINNRRAWAGIEKATRKYVMRATGPVYVITGPVYLSGSQSIGPGRVAVPTHLFKLVYDPTTKRAWAHWLENSDTAKVSKPISYAELVDRTGIQFLSVAD